VSPVVTPPPIEPIELLRRALAIVDGTKEDMADRLGIVRSHFSRVLGGSRLNISNCLRLADLLGEEPALVLRAYKYDEEADILDRAYPRRGRQPQGDVAVLDALERLPHTLRRSTREHIVRVADALTPERQPLKKRR
jgi:transcriptional regulator with XRE-family HTH domain